jgi:ribosomal protein L29
MKKKDIAKKNTKELQTLLAEKKTALRDFRFGVSGSNARNVKEGKELRKDIARVLTALNREVK